jgi:hypothetical protein
VHLTDSQESLRDSLAVPGSAMTLADSAIDAGVLAATAIAKIWETALTEAYGTDGSAHTAAQLLYLALAHAGEFAIVDAEKILKKLDGSTTAATYQLDDDTDPTSITRTG